MMWRYAICVLLCFGTGAAAEVRVVDGDTLELNGKVIRLNGIDAPEHGQKCGEWDCGAQATEALVEIVKGQEVTCEAIANDGYGRTIATCFADGKDVAEAMIGDGMAWAFRQYSTAYVDAEEVAKARDLGVWRGRFTPPWEFRRDRWEAAEQAAPDGCPIKGNISDSGRIYHAPWSPWYGRTRINEKNGERWFCSEDQAIAAGWRAPRWR